MHKKMLGMRGSDVPAQNPESSEKYSDPENPTDSKKKVDSDGDNDQEDTMEEEVEHEVEEEETNGTANGDDADKGSDGEDEKKKHAELLELPPQGSDVYLGGIPRDASEEDLRAGYGGAGFTQPLVYGGGATPSGMATMPMLFYLMEGLDMYCNSQCCNHMSLHQYPEVAGMAVALVVGNAVMIRTVIDIIPTNNWLHLDSKKLGIRSFPARFLSQCGKFSMVALRIKI